MDAAPIFSAAIFLSLASAIAITVHAGTIVPYVVAQRDYFRLAQAFVLFGVSGWSLYGVAVGIIAELGLERRNALYEEPTNTDYRSFYLREANSKLFGSYSLLPGRSGNDLAVAHVRGACGACKS